LIFSLVEGKEVPPFHQREKGENERKHKSKKELIVKNNQKLKRNKLKNY